MSEITIAKMDGFSLGDKETEVIRSLFERSVVGIDKENQKRWRKFLRTLIDGEIGECWTFAFKFSRSGRNHRRHMALESYVYQAQERIKDFNQFRYWLKVGSGFVDWMSGPKGGVVPVPKSISFASCDEAEFQNYHESIVEFLRTEHAIKFLWPHLSPKMGADMIESVLQDFNE